MWMFWDRIDYTWNVMGHSWGLLKQQKSLLVFPLLSGIACALVLLTFLVPLGFADKLDYLLSENERIKAGVNPLTAYGITFLYYFVNYFVVVFFNSALVGCAAKHIAGEPTSVGQGLAIAVARLPQILGWSLLSATIGTVLRVIENAHSKAGEIMASILGTAWTLMTFLVVPALVVDGYGPFEAVSTSTRLLKKTWGDQLVGNWSFGLIFLFVAAPGWAAIIYAIVDGHLAHHAMLLGAGVAWLILVACVQSALHTIFQASLYIFTRDGEAPQGFPASVLQGACGRAA